MDKSVVEACRALSRPGGPLGHSMTMDRLPPTMRQFYKGPNDDGKMADGCAILNLTPLDDAPYPYPYKDGPLRRRVMTSVSESIDLDGIMDAYPNAYYARAELQQLFKRGHMYPNGDLKPLRLLQAPRRAPVAEPYARPPSSVCTVSSGPGSTTTSPTGTTGPGGPIKRPRGRVPKAKVKPGGPIPSRLLQTAPSSRSRRSSSCSSGSSEVSSRASRASSPLTVVYQSGPSAPTGPRLEPIQELNDSLPAPPPPPPSVPVPYQQQPPPVPRYPPLRLGQAATDQFGVTWYGVTPQPYGANMGYGAPAMGYCTAEYGMPGYRSPMGSMLTPLNIKTEPGPPQPPTSAPSYPGMQYPTGPSGYRAPMGSMLPPLNINTQPQCPPPMPAHSIPDGTWVAVPSGPSGFAPRPYGNLPYAQPTVPSANSSLRSQEEMNVSYTHL